MAIGVRERIKEDGSGKKPTRFYSSKQEKQVAKVVNGKQVANSGATPWAKGDVTADKVLVECKTKTTPSETITVHKDWLVKNKEESVFMGKEYSVLAFNFGPDEDNYYILDEGTFSEFLEYLNNKSN